MLGAGLIRAIRSKVPDALFEGVAGPAMIDAGCVRLHDADALAVMGLIEPLTKIPRLLLMRRSLIRRWRATPHIWMPYCQMKTSPLPVPVVATEGVHLILADGRQLIDGLASWWSVCGYAITKQVAAQTDETIRLTPGVLYPLLHQMEKQGFVKAEWDAVKAESGKSKHGRQRKWYRLSAKGRRRLKQRAAAHRAYQQLIESFLPAAD